MTKWDVFLNQHLGPETTFLSNKPNPNHIPNLNYEVLQKSDGNNSNRPCNENSIVVMGDPILWDTVSISLMRKNGFLPFTEAV